MFELLLGILLVVSVLCFALIGFIHCCIKLFGGGGSSGKKTVLVNKTPKKDLTQRSLLEDVRSSTFLLNYLRKQNLLSSKDYDTIRGYLDQQFPDAKLAERHVPPSNDKVQLETTSENTSFEKAKSAVNEPVVATVVAEVSASVETKSIESNGTKSESLAPWDRPDPPPRTPRRSFSEVMSGFMQEKNIRWGELASGILIVGSAVGLVVSLRDELRDTIPYFSSLLFMLITAAIHASGIYTLKQWKLRNTSRGTLLIGLLLVPLNIVGACILSGSEGDRRELSDPLLWIAIVIGLTSFATMTWYSSKCLLRRGQLPLVISILGCCVGTLLINRSDIPEASSLRRLLLTIPLGLSFLIGTAAFYKQQWLRERWGARSAYRMYVFLGLSSFAALAAGAMLVVRATDKSSAIISLLPLVTLMSLLTTWLGRISWKGAAGKTSQTLRLTGLSLHLLGLGVMAISICVSASNPTILLVNSAIAATGLIIFAWHQQESNLLPAAWAALSVFVFCSVSLLLGKLHWDVWSNFSELGTAALSGETGLAMLATGAAVVSLHWLYSKRSINESKMKKVGFLSGGAIFATGCALALAASIVNRSDLFDVMTSSGLLGLGSLLAMTICVVAMTKTYLIGAGQAGVEKARWITLLTAATLFGFLIHLLIWNRWVAQWANRLALEMEANWVLVFAIHGFLLALVAAITRALFIRTGKKQDANQLTNFRLVPELLGDYSFAGIALAMFSALFFIYHQTGFSTAIFLTMSASLLVLIWVQANYHVGVKFWTNAFTISTGMTLFVVITELLTRADWCPSPATTKFWLIQCVALSVWANVCLTVNWFLGKKKSFSKFVDFNPRVEWIVTHSLVVGMLGLVGGALASETNLELFKEATSPMVSLRGEMAWSYAALVAISIGLFFSSLRRPLAITGMAIVLVWFLLVGFSANSFADTKAVGTALRWFLPIGGFIGALLVASRRPLRPGWALARMKLGLKGRSTWTAATTQHLINAALGLVATIVLVISTVAISQVLMNGGVSALGGPDKGTLFGDMKKDLSYGIPIAIMVGTFLLYAISERRKWLATAGSLVFQYCVLLSVVLLFLSPHEKLATSWFVNILQAVSVGMTGYGFIWLLFRKRIEGLQSGLNSTTNSDSAKSWASQIEVHTFINGLLISALATLVVIRFYNLPAVAGGWISSVGGWLGVLAWLVFSVLAFSVWKRKLFQAHRTSTWMWLACWSGMILVGMVAALVDRYMMATESFVPWRTFNVILWGAICVCLIQVVLLWLERRPELTAGWFQGNLFRERATLQFYSIRSDQSLPLLFLGAIVMLFALRGMTMDPSWYWSYFTSALVLVGCVTFAGIARQSPWLAFVSAGLTASLAFCLVRHDPQGWFTEDQPYYANVLSSALAILALAWSGAYVFKSLNRKAHGKRNTNLTTKPNQVRPSMVWMPNLVLFFCSLWILLGSIAQWITESDSFFAGARVLDSSWGMGAIVGPLLLIIVNFWSDRRKGWVVSTWMWFTGMVIFILAIVIPDNALRFSSIILALGAVTTLSGLIWVKREAWFGTARKLRVPRLVSIERSMTWQFPTFGFIIGLIAIVFAFVSSMQIDVRVNRYLVALSPLLVAIGIGLFSDQHRRRWLQMLALSLITLSAVFLSWADLLPVEIQARPIRLFVRTLLTFAGAMFVYGALVSRWVDANGRWLKSFKEMSVGTCLFALVCLVVLILEEFRHFVPGVGCGLPITEAAAVVVVVMGMIVGLIVIAVLPKNDPFSFSLQGRMGYVYVAQLTAAILGIHLYLTMPFLFRIGIKEYWPYIAMMLCFSSVGVARVLERRNLKVLSEPIFTTAALLPILVAACIWGIDSRADVALVMLMIGLIYLVISYINESLLAGCAAILFGNLALWLFYNKFQGFSFFVHPQLWLIPPALSTLVASQVMKNSLSRSQLALVRYICVTIIYLSSTSEIFINGMGEKLWPPMILAVLSIGGIFAGMIFQIRAYLYLGLVFLLLSFITMVSHAHQRFDHVWPWWAFGFAMGVAILVMFGLFEKKRNEMKQVFGQLREWDL